MAVCTYARDAQAIELVNTRATTASEETANGLTWNPRIGNAWVANRDTHGGTATTPMCQDNANTLLWIPRLRRRPLIGPNSTLVPHYKCYARGVQQPACGN